MSDRGQQGAAPVAAERDQRRARRPVPGGGRRRVQIDERGVDQLRAPSRRPQAVMARRVGPLERGQLVLQPRDRSRNGRRRVPGAHVTSASGPRSPVRIRMTCSASVTQILPSPILPVRAAFSIASITPCALVLGHEHLDLHLRHEVHLVLGAAVHLGVAALAPEPLDVGGGQAVHADVAQRLLDLVDAVRLHDRGDELHVGPLSAGVSSLAGLDALLDDDVLPHRRHPHRSVELEGSGDVLRVHAQAPRTDPASREAREGVREQRPADPPSLVLRERRRARTRSPSRRSRRCCCSPRSCRRPPRPARATDPTSHRRAAAPTSPRTSPRSSRSA